MLFAVSHMLVLLKIFHLLLSLHTEADIAERESTLNHITC